MVSSQAISKNFHIILPDRFEKEREREQSQSAPRTSSPLNVENSHHHDLDTSKRGSLVRSPIIDCSPNLTVLR